MATAQNAKLMKESGQSLFDYSAATDSGDHKIFTVSGKTTFSKKSGYELVVRPDGIDTGRNMLSPHADNDKLIVAAFTCFLAGLSVSVSATTATITRPATAVAKIVSICIDSAGAIEVLAGTDSSDANFSEVRDAAGGPPLITVGSIEIGQARVSSDTAAAITLDEIFQVPGTHAERSDTPAWEISTTGRGNKADVAAKTNAFIEFGAVVGTGIHVGGTYKKVYVKGYTPLFAEISKSVDFVPAQNSHTLSSTQIYNGTVGSSSSTLQQAGFKAMMNDGITDSLIADEDEVLMFKFFSDRNKTAYSLTQGLLGIKSTFPANDQIQAEATISAEEKTANFSS